MQEKIREKAHIKLLELLFKARGKLDSFTLFNRSRLSFSEFVYATKFIFDEHLAEEKGNHIQLTRWGKDFISTAKRKKEHNPSWRKINDDLRIYPIAINEPYIPNIDLLDKKTFHIKSSNVD